MNVYLKDRRLIGAILYLILLGCLGMSADYLACSDCLISFEPNKLSAQVSVYSPPGTIELTEEGKEVIHYFGTDHIGRDVASRLIHGIAIAFKVGIWSSAIALLVAFLLGSLSGYLGDRTHQLNLIQYLIILLGLILINYYATEWGYSFNDRGDLVYSGWRYVLLSVGLWSLLLWFLRFVGRLSLKRYWVPWDTIVVKGIEVFRSIPRLFLLLAIFAVISRPSITAVILIIGFIRWPALTRLIRAEILNVRQDDYIRNAQILGLPGWRILTYHVLPNIYRPVIVLTAFNMGSAILIEATLSFLQIGLPLDSVSWGSMLGQARSYLPAWWMAIGPGFLIFSLILAFNVLGDRLSDHFRALN